MTQTRSHSKTPCAATTKKNNFRHTLYRPTQRIRPEEDVWEVCDTDPQTIKHPVQQQPKCEPVWPSGKALG